MLARFQLQYNTTIDVYWNSQMYTYIFPSALNQPTYLKSCICLIWTLRLLHQMAHRKEKMEWSWRMQMYSTYLAMTDHGVGAWTINVRWCRGVAGIRLIDIDIMSNDRSRSRRVNDWCAAGTAMRRLMEADVTGIDRSKSGRVNEQRVRFKCAFFNNLFFTYLKKIPFSE